MTEEQTNPGQIAPSEPVLIDAGNVLILIKTEDGKAMPIPLPAVFEQLFGVLGDIDQRLIKLEEGPETESRIITV